METLFALDNVWIALLLKVVAVLIIFLTVPLVMGYMEHKVLAHMQARLGPMEALPHGVGQLIADGIKFLQKENIVPTAADKWVFGLAPGVMLVPAIVVLTVVPFGPGAFAENLDAGIFFALAVSSVSTIGLLMAGWASANKFSLMGGLRGAAQLIAYELPMVLAAAAVVLQAETLSLVGIVEAQANFELFNTVTIPYAIPHAFGLGLFFMAAVAELNRPPFDMPIADAELIAGHMTEYTGIRFAFFLLSEYAGMVVFGALATVLFLGGWYPWPGYLLPEGWLGVVVGFGTTIAKIAGFMFVFIWLRATFPRLREDQLQRLSWLILIPLALLNIVVVAIAKVVG
jgi:NADH-quinone oxidoreductase subunit H